MLCFRMVDNSAILSVAWVPATWREANEFSFARPEFHFTNVKDESLAFNLITTALRANGLKRSKRYAIMVTTIQLL